MRRFALWAVLFLLLTAGCLLPWLLIDSTAEVEAPPAFNRQDIVWAQALFNKYDPRRGSPGVTQSLSLRTDEINRLMNYAVAFNFIEGMEADIQNQRAVVGASLKLPRTPFGRYLNISVELISGAGEIEIAGVRVGSVPLPGLVGRWAGHLAHRFLTRDPAYAAITQNIRGIAFEQDRVTMDYAWGPEILAQLQRKGAALLISEADRIRLLGYASFIQKHLRTLPRGSKLPLHQLIQPVFALAATRNDPVNENRAAITALAAYVSGVSLPRLFSAEGTKIRRAPRVLPRLHGRTDFAQHYLIAAAVAANGGSRLANALGLAKEEDDAERGSGFSFTDLAADRAAARLGERLIGRDAEKTRLTLARAASDADLMPDFNDLPEFMPADEFSRRFGRVGSERYQAVIHEIDKRLALHPLLGSSGTYRTGFSPIRP